MSDGKNEKNKKVFRKRGKSYTEYILAVMDEVHSKYRKAQAKHYSEAVAKYISENTKEKYTAEQVRTSVQRTLLKLTKDDCQTLIRYGKFYLKNDPQNLFEKLSSEYYSKLKVVIKAESDRVCYISYNMCAIEVTSLSDKDVDECIEECIGDWCYQVYGVGDKYYVTVKCSKDRQYVANEHSQEYTVLKALEDAVVRLYMDRQRLRKRQRRKSKE